ncbi:LuxR C-terminal-related transcriptional regulator [Microbacterium sp. P01]|uniref:helix-turn-helix transcriptional regulator n=1 Tax=Microbacterium sp. P01 TaxID=3366261 RepID=UPI00366D761E
MPDRSGQARRPIDIRQTSGRSHGGDAATRDRARGSKPSSRQAALARATELLQRRQSALLVGPNGWGKSFEIARIGTRLQASGRAVHHLRGRGAEGGRAIAEWRQSPSGAVLLVDDGESMPDQTLSSIIELARSTDRVTLIALEMDSAHTDAGLSRGGTARLLDVWRSGAIQRVDLPGLDRDEARALAVASAGGNVLDDMAQEMIVRLSQGSPLVVSELTKDALETGSGFYRPRSILSLGDVGVSPRVRDLTTPLLDRLDDDGRYALVMLAQLGATPYPRAAKLLGEHALHQVLRFGLARNDGSTLDRIVADELHAWAALADWRRSWRLRSHDRVQRLLVADLQKANRLAPHECFIVGRFWTNAPDDEVLTGIPPGTAAAVLLTAAYVANVSGLPGDGLLCASRAFSFAPSLAAALQQSRSLAMLGDVVGALQVLRVDDSTTTDDETLAERVGWTEALSRWNGPEALKTAMKATTEALSATHRTVAERAALVDAWRISKTADPAAVDEMFARMLADDHATTASRLWAAAGLLGCLAPFHDIDRVHRVLTEGDRVYQGIPDSTNHPLSHSTRDARAAYVLTATLTRIYAGLPWTGIRHDIEEFAARARWVGGQLSAADQSVIGLLTATLALLDRDYERALADLRVVESLLDTTLPPDVHTQASLITALALVAHGDVAAAERRRAALNRKIVDASPLLRSLADSLDVAVLLRTADPQHARTTLHDRAADRRRAPLTRVWLAHVSLETGASASIAVGLIADLRGTPLAPLPDAMLRLLDADASGDASATERSARDLERLGVTHHAAGAFQLAERQHSLAGRPGHARRCAEHAERLLAPDSPVESARETETDAAASDVVQDAPGPHGEPDPDVDLTSLTRRELEVARLVAQRLSNQEIADRLFLSVRTVESHVLQARMKLGADRRRDLGRFVGS